MKSLQIAKVKFNVDALSDKRIRLVPKSDRQDSLPALAEYVLTQRLSGITDVLCTDAELLISYTDDLKSVIKQLKSVKLPPESSISHFELPVCFSKGLDWDLVESQTGLKKTKVISSFLKTTFRFEMYGFLPGFMYLSGLPESIQCQRKAKPRQHMAAGTIALGGPYAGMYNLDSPGGWQSIGYSPIRPFSIKGVHDPLIKIQDTVKFYKISIKETAALDKQKLSINDYKVK